MIGKKDSRPGQTTVIFDCNGIKAAPQRSEKQTWSWKLSSIDSWGYETKLKNETERAWSVSAIWEQGIV